MLLRGINEHDRRILLVKYIAALNSLKGTFLEFYYSQSHTSFYHQI